MTVGATRRVWIAVAIVVVPLLAYPLVSLAGGGAHFPGEGDCDRPPESGRPVRVVFSRFDSPVEAEEFRDGVVRYGFVGTDVQGDDCGRWMVVLDGVPNEDVGRDVVEEAQTVGLNPTLELDPDG